MKTVEKLYKFTAYAGMPESQSVLVESDWILLDSYEQAETRFIGEFLNDEILVDEIDQYANVTITHETLLRVANT